MMNKTREEYPRRVWLGRWSAVYRHPAHESARILPNYLKPLPPLDDTFPDTFSHFNF